MQLLSKTVSKIYNKVIKINNDYCNSQLEKKFLNTKFIGKNNITHLDKISIGQYTCLKDTYIDSSGFVEIGNYVHGATNVTIFSSDHIYNGDLIPFSYQNKYSKVIIKDFVWIGEGVKILPGVTIEEGAIIGMGAVVTRDVAPFSIVAGNPATHIKYRDKELFIKNKIHKRFRGL